jgi:hypothetical protein
MAELQLSQMPAHETRISNQPTPRRQNRARAPTIVKINHGTGGNANAAKIGFQDWIPSRMTSSFTWSDRFQPRTLRDQQ